LEESSFSKVCGGRDALSTPCGPLGPPWLWGPKRPNQVP
jgi:hypothetical protein